MIVTRQLQVFAAQPDYERLRAICEKVGHMRTYLWQRFGGLATFKQTVGEIRQYITELHPFDRLELDGTVRAENTKDIINDIVAYREENGRFQNTEELMQISGIKEGLYNKIKDNITV